MQELLKRIDKHKGAILFVGLFVLVLVLDQLFGFSKMIAGEESVRAIRALLEQNYWLAVGAYFVLTIVGSVVLALPGALFAIAAAPLFGAGMGTLWCVLAATIGACGAFLVGRYLLKDTLKPWVCRNEAIRKLLFENHEDNAVMLLAITRLVPLFPFNIQNFAYGITDIRFSTYAWCTLLFLVPGTALYTFATEGLIDAEGRWLYLGLAGVMLVVTLGLGAVLRDRDLLQRLEKAHYPFRNWRHAERVVFFPGCNVQSFFPETTEAVARLLRERGDIGVVYDCCGKPLEVRGMGDEGRVLEGLRSRLRKHGVEELVCACPNCYYYLGSRLEGVRVVSVYEKLDELGLLPEGAIEGSCAVFPPCPDKGSLALFNQGKGVFFEEPDVLRATPCCGLGKPGFGKTQKERDAMAQACLGAGTTVTYCASCAWRLEGQCGEGQRVCYLLSAVVGTDEAPQTRGSLANRAKAVFR